jgi:hypothetical protein
LHNTAGRPGAVRGSVRPMVRSQLEEILHRMNNLFGAIEIQAEVARGDGSADALVQALDTIVEASRRAQRDLTALVRGGSAGSEPRT